MLIILEGPDGAGKTTLAAKLEHHLRDKPVRILHKGPPTCKTGLEEYLLPLADYDPAKHHVICDRYHLGELVYPALTGRQSLFDGDHGALEFRYLEMFLASRGALVVHVDTRDDAIHERLNQRGDAVQDYEYKVFQQQAAFNSVLIHRTRLPIINYVSDDSDSDLDEIIDPARAYANQVDFLEFNRTYVGPPRPAYLLMGDVRGKRQREYPTAFAPLSGASGLYLLESVRAHWLRYGMFGMLNVHEGSIFKPWKALGSPPVVTLGIAARLTARSSGVPAGSVPHPQYIRRFHHRARADYGLAIEHAASTGEDLIRWRP